jgi:hypothetical protein
MIWRGKNTRGAEMVDEEESIARKMRQEEMARLFVLMEAQINSRVSSSSSTQSCREVSRQADRNQYEYLDMA